MELEVNAEFYSEPTTTFWYTEPLILITQMLRDPKLKAEDFVARFEASHNGEYTRGNSSARVGECEHSYVRSLNVTPLPLLLLVCTCR